MIRKIAVAVYLIVPCHGLSVTAIERHRNTGLGNRMNLRFDRAMLYDKLRLSLTTAPDPQSLM